MAAVVMPAARFQDSRRPACWTDRVSRWAGTRWWRVGWEQGVRLPGVLIAGMPFTTGVVAAGWGTTHAGRAKGAFGESARTAAPDVHPAL